ncbi:cysteine desulfurase [Heterostelium album PN500]|uniref:cysteine desulfurase n=1 Tax=Heterostelium pallidum (strain ATCC 26659 / Pp 5 / PN500) TaxID=670386 RepID=D3AXT8_HETP5|nr:cysteine desulfurase [Heterostelium album PN500]EFA85765.1 cysteine desulfurase [Heterostelium album PN500]|eukprot:XP_020437871.1 cysteine desulfurase [Heterostelium album PN500]
MNSLVKNTLRFTTTGGSYRTAASTSFSVNNVVRSNLNQNCLNRSYATISTPNTSKDSLQPIYLDNQATTPVDPRVLDVMLSLYTENYGNPHSKTHDYGWKSSDYVENARQQVASLIGSDPKEVIFTSGATESNNIALKGVARFYKEKKNHIITTVTEHKCVLDSCRHLEQEGFKVTYLPVLSNGLIDLAQLEAAITPQTVLISVMAVNNEIGVIQPLKEIGKLCRSKGIFFHTDAAQAVGKIPIDVNEMNIDLMSISGHKVYGPKGIGALYLRRRPRVRIEAIQSGGGQERGIRSGTVPATLVTGFGAACAISQNEMQRDAVWIKFLYDRLLKGIQESIPHVKINGDTEHRYYGNLNISFSYVEGESLLMAIKDIACSSGSACTSASLEPSYVLRSLGLEEDMAHSSIRFGIGRFTTVAEIDFTIELLKKHVQRLRDMSPLWEMVQEGIDLKTINWNQVMIREHHESIVLASKKIITLAVGSLVIKNKNNYYQKYLCCPVKPYDVNKFINYALVCKDWFDIISKSMSSKYLIDLYNSEYESLSNFLNHSIGLLSKPKSICPINNIKDLYILDNFDNPYTKIPHVSIFISKFDHLERLNINTTNMGSIKEIIEIKPTIKIHLYLNSMNYGVDLEYIDYSVLEHVTMNIDHNFKVIGIYGELDFDFDSVRVCRVNTLYFEHNQDHSSHYVLHIPYTELFEIESLTSIEICSNDYVDIKDLKLFLNDRVESMKCATVLGLFGHDVNNELDECRCVYHEEVYFKEEEYEYQENEYDQYYIQNLISNNNQTSEWMEFCQRLANNKTLKNLSLSNFCVIHKITDLSIFILVSDNFVQSLSINTTISKLEISCDILDESFYSMLASNKNTTITKLKLFDLDCKHLLWTAIMLKSNKHITKLSIESFIHDFNYHPSEILKETLKDFILTLDSSSHQLVCSTIRLSKMCYTEDESYYFLKSILTRTQPNVQLCQVFDEQNINWSSVAIKVY